MERGGPFGFDELDLEWLLAKPGAKWHRPNGLLAAWVADMDFPPAPVILDAMRAVIDGGDLGYPDWPGLGRSPLRAVFAQRMMDRYGWELDPADTFELNDVMHGVQVVLERATRPGDAVVLHTPAYPPFLETLERMGRTRVDVPAVRSSTGWAYDHDALTRSLARHPACVLLLCHPQNPTGHVFPRHELEQLAALAIEHDLLVISDEIHADLVYEPATHVPFSSLGPEVAARTVTITSASKAFNLAGLRWAIAHVGPPWVRDRLREVPAHYYGAPNLMAVAATMAAWSDGAAWLDSVRRLLDRNRHLVADLLAEQIPSIVVTVPEATYLSWLDCRALGMVEDPAEVFRGAGVELSPGPGFGPGGEGFARMNFATSRPLLERIVGRMAEAVRGIGAR